MTPTHDWTAPKTCARCGAVFVEADWKALLYLGLAHFLYPGDTVETFEYRNCSCGTTIQVTLGEVTLDEHVSKYGKKDL